MLHRHHIAAAAGYHLGHLFQLAGFVLQCDGQVGLAAAHDKTTGDDAVQDVHINVAAGDDAGHLFALHRQLVEQHRRHRHSACTLGHQFLVLHQGENGRRRLVLGHGNDIVHILLAQLIGQLARGLDLNAVRKGGGSFQGLVLVLVQAAVHTGGTLGLYTVHLDLRPQGLDGKGNAGDQSAAAHRHHHSVHIRQLVKDFQADGALPGDDLLVIVGVDKGHVVLLLQLHGLIVGFIVGAGHKADLRAQIFGILHLHQGRAVRHTDDAADAAPGSRQRHALRMVARRAGNDALCAFLFGKLADLIVSAPHLKAAGSLQVLGLEVQLAVLGKLGGFDEVGLSRHVLQHKGGVVDLIQSQHDRYFLYFFVMPSSISYKNCFVK